MMEAALAPETTRVVFRDPAPLDDAARSLEHDIARILVNAPSLPVWLPPFRMFLNAVGLEGKAFVLQLGDERERRLASLRIERVSGEAHARVTITEQAANGADLDRRLAVMRDRLGKAVTAERWSAARARAKKLRTLPVGVPLHALRQVIDGIDPPAGLVRTGFRCNQDCGLCWQGRDWGDYGGAQVRTWIEDLAAGGVRALTISGGEPTIDPEIAGHIAHAKALGFRTIALETNAIQMAKPGFAERLRDAGLSECFVSLHSADAAVSDALTRAPGTHAKTVAGVQALLRAGVPVVLNAVMTAAGLATLPALPDFVRDSFGATKNVRGLVLSFPTTPFERSLLDSIVPEPEPMRAALRPAVARALELGLDLGGVAGPCGVPLCAFGADPRVADPARVVPRVPFRTYLPGCDGCSVRGACYGVRNEDAERFGGRCVQPIA